MDFKDDLLNKMREANEKREKEKMIFDTKSSYYIGLLKNIGYCKTMIEQRRKEKQDYSVFQFKLDCLNKQLKKFKERFFVNYFNY